MPGDKKNKTNRKVVKGAFWKLTYQALDSKGQKRKDLGAPELLENFKAAALEKGGKIILERRKDLVFTLPRSDGGITWCRVQVNPRHGQQYLYI